MLPFPHNPYHPSKSRFRQTFSDNFPQTLACHDSVYAKAMGIIFNWYNGFIKLVEMKSFIRFWLLVLAVSYTCTHVFAQKNNKVFYKENFASGKLPDGWKNVDVHQKGCEWVITNQPYPGSFEYQQQAPPIASSSRGYHLQYQAGYIVDEDQPRWIKKNEYPDAYIQTAAINCSGKSSVILHFQHTFRYNNIHPEDGAGLYVGVSTDSVNWTDYNVQHNLPAATDMFNPLKEELNISSVAANHDKVYLRFYWKGYYSWYWMIDDIELAEAYTKDISAVRLVSHTEEDNHFKQDDQLVLRIKNSGMQAISNSFTINCIIDKTQTFNTTVDAASKPIQPGEERDITFPKINLAGSPVHNISFIIKDAGDENQSNNSFAIRLNASATSLGNMDGFEKKKNEFDFSSGITKVKVIFYRDDIFRIWLAPDGNFTNPADSDIVINYPSPAQPVTATDAGDYIKLQSKSCVLRVYRKPLHFAMYNATNTKAIWEELKPIVFGSKTIQSLTRKEDEYFYGCGMQNGYFSHRGKTVLIEKGNGWDDGGRPNPSPFYMSTAGYGVLRNTFDAGKYAFNDTVELSHNENRFDAFYFYGPSLKNILNDYTDITGKPFLMPRWALNLGDANCYNKPDRNKQPQTTPDVIWKVADEYVKHDMPRGWILPNDGYGCGYVKLDSVVKELHKRGIYTGLWTENGVEKIATEVGKYGTRLCKLDVAWVGPGYKFALDGCRAAYNGIENNSDARGYVWSVMGWAGTQRYSTVWSGDQSGNWEYIRFHIPTFTGAGLSAQNAASSDIDGIFRGSDSTYTRDLQWKCFIPVLMTMSGWAKKDKQPWVYGEPYTSINRKYLRLKMRLTPYMYTLCHEANVTGVPATRAMVLEFPKDSVTWGKSTQYQFMNGPSLLVAPVYKSEDERDSIYLPAGKWYDYWSGEIYNGNQWLRHYNAPLEKLPLFVKAGAILPMYPQMNYDAERPADTLTLDIYPQGNSSFNMYEDDGLTREHRKGAFATTLLQVSTQKNITVTINTVKGYYKGIYKQRSYQLHVHSGKAPSQVLLNGKAIKFSFDANDRNGIISINTPFVSTFAKQVVTLMF